MKKPHSKKKPRIEPAAEPTAESPRSQTPRPECQTEPPCTAWQTKAGCGYLDANQPCRHSVERHRFDAAGRDVTGLYGLYDDDTDHEILVETGGPQMVMFQE